MSIWQEFKKWVETLFHHAQAGTLPPAPTSTSGPVLVPPAPTPEPAAAPAPAPSVTPVVAPPTLVLPDGVLEIDARGFAKLTAIEAERSSNPKWANACAWYAIEGLPNESFGARANMTEAKFLLMMGSSGAVGDGAAALNTAYAMTAGGNGFGYVRGTPYADALSFIGDNVDAAGNVLYRGPRPADMAAFVAACNSTGRLPVIDHSQRGAVA